MLNFRKLENFRILSMEMNRASVVLKFLLSPTSKCCKKGNSWPLAVEFMGR